jgi:deoxyribonuclease V
MGREPAPSYSWPVTFDDLERVQEALGRATPPAWILDAGARRVGGCAVCFARPARGPGEAGDDAFAAAVLLDGDRVAASSSIRGVAPAPFRAGLLAAREGPLLEEAVRALGGTPEVLFVGAAGLDHPRRAGLALHLGAVLGIPTVGVTTRPFVGHGEAPASAAGATASIRRGDEVVALWVRVRAGVRPLVAHAAWRTSPETAAALVLAASRGARTPEPLRRARMLARGARAASAPRRT